jgi:hypothetical protein
MAANWAMLARRKTKNPFRERKGLSKTGLLPGRNTRRLDNLNGGLRDPIHLQPGISAADATQQID